MNLAAKSLSLGIVLAAVPVISAQEAAEEGGILGGLDGRKARWKRAGVTPFFNYTADALRVAKGGYETGDALAGVADFGLEVDFARVGTGAGVLWIQGLYFHGDDATAELIGDFNYADNIVAAPGFRLYQVTYQIERGAWSAKLGLMAVDEDFGCSETAEIFVNSAYGPVPTLSWNSALPIWPVNALGVRLSREVGDRFSVRLGVYDGGAEEDGHHSRGTRVHLSSREGALAIAEVAAGWGTEEAAGSANVGVWWHSGEFERFGGDPDSRGNHGFHLTLDQALGRTGRWRGFARLGYAPRDDRNYVETHVDLGVVAQGLLAGRPDDTVGLGYFRTDFPARYLASRRGAGDPVTPREEGVELTYSFSVGRGVWIQPDLQYLFEAHETGSRTLLGIIRLYVEF